MALRMDGRIEQVGWPEEFYARPASLAVAEFLLMQNIYRGRVARQTGPGQYVVDFPGGQLQVHTYAALAVAQKRVGTVKRPWES